MLQDIRNWIYKFMLWIAFQEKNKILQEIQDREGQLNREKEAKEALANKIKVSTPWGAGRVYRIERVSSIGRKRPKEALANKIKVS